MSKYPLLAEVFPDGVLPSLNGRVLEGAYPPKQYFEAGLPNITGVITIDDNIVVGNTSEENVVFGVYQDGALYMEKGEHAQNTYTSAGVAKWNHDYRLRFDASRSNSLYGRSGTVQMAAYGVTYHVCYGG